MAVWLWLSGFVYCFCGARRRTTRRPGCSVRPSFHFECRPPTDGRTAGAGTAAWTTKGTYGKNGSEDFTSFSPRRWQAAGGAARARSPACRRSGPTQGCGVCVRASEGSTCVLPPVSWPPLSRPPSETPFDSCGQSAPRFKTLPDVMHVSCLRHRRPRRRRLPSFFPSACSNSQLTYMSYMYLGLS